MHGIIIPVIMLGLYPILSKLFPNKDWTFLKSKKYVAAVVLVTTPLCIGAIAGGFFIGLNFVGLI